MAGSGISPQLNVEALVLSGLASLGGSTLEGFSLAGDDAVGLTQVQPHPVDQALREDAGDLFSTDGGDRGSVIDISSFLALGEKVISFFASNGNRILRSDNPFPTDISTDLEALIDSGELPSVVAVVVEEGSDSSEYQLAKSIPAEYFYEAYQAVSTNSSAPLTKVNHKRWAAFFILMERSDLACQIYFKAALLMIEKGQYYLADIAYKNAVVLAKESDVIVDDLLERIESALERDEFSVIAKIELMRWKSDTFVAIGNFSEAAATNYEVIIMYEYILRRISEEEDTLPQVRKMADKYADKLIAAYQNNIEILLLRIKEPDPEDPYMSVMSANRKILTSYDEITRLYNERLAIGVSKFLTARKTAVLKKKLEHLTYIIALHETTYDDPLGKAPLLEEKIQTEAAIREIDPHAVLDLQGFRKANDWESKIIKAELEGDFQKSVAIRQEREDEKRKRAQQVTLEGWMIPWLSTD